MSHRNLDGSMRPDTLRATIHPWIHSLSWQRAALIAFALGLCMFLIVCQLPADRVGDGAEYYAMYMAVKFGHHPYMTEAAFQAYDRLYSSEQIQGLLDTARMRHAFPPLIQGDTADFNHFWFYPALAALAGGWLEALGAGPHQAFLLLHALLFALLIFVSGRAYGRLGILAALFVTIGSPMVWFINKVHTEFFTYCCVAIATTWFARKHYFAAAVALALASTQNISIAATAMASLAVGAWEGGWIRFRIRWQDLLMAVLAIALVALHPLYYLSRVGVIDPQLLAGGAKIGTNLGSAFIWLLDPDVGLVPNWPISLVLLALGVAAMRRTSRPSWQMTAYVVVFLITNLYAQASTQNLNSGATVYIARYATWYIGLFVPLLGFSLASFRSAPAWGKEGLAVALCVAAIFNAVVFRPAQHETYMEPTWLSEKLQHKLPRFYNPPAQIFWERFSRRSIDDRSFAVIGPDCKKILIVKQDGFDVVPQSDTHCGYDLTSLPDRVLNPTDFVGEIQDRRKYNYIYLTPAERRAALFAFRVGVHYAPTLSDHKSASFFGTGWYPREQTGIWTQGDVAKLWARLDSCPASGLRLFLTLTPHLTPKNPHMALRVVAGGVDVGKRELTEGGRFYFDIPCSAVHKNQLTLDLHVLGWMSPLNAGVSDDWRDLGLFLSEFWFEPQVGGATQVP